MPIANATVLVDRIVPGFIAETEDEASKVENNTSSEFVSTSITFSVYANVRYLVTYQGNCESSVAGDDLLLQLRWRNCMVEDLRGVVFAKTSMTSDQPQYGMPFTLFGTFISTTDGPVTVVATIQRVNGTGFVEQNAVSNNGSLHFLCENV